MKCPRCKSVCEDPESVYCLNCGKKLRLENAFGEEFEEEFLFDEERDAKEAAQRLQEEIKHQIFVRKTLVALGIALSITVIVAVVLAFLLFGPKGQSDSTVPSSNDEEKTYAPAQTEALTKEQESTLEKQARAVLFAANRDYDIDTLLRLSPAELHPAIIQALLQENDCQNREELEALFVRKKEQAPTFSQIDIHVQQPMGQIEFEEFCEELCKNHPELNQLPSRAVYVEISAIVHDSNTTEEFPFYLLIPFGEFDDAFFCLEI